MGGRIGDRIGDGIAHNYVITNCIWKVCIFCGFILSMN